jgi:RimJ/RimL family protein N-acetyltransferase
MMTIRELDVQDASAFGELLARLDSESNFMLFEPGERDVTEEEQRRRIAAMKTAGNQVVFVAEANHTLIGFVGVSRGAQRRNRTTASVVVGVSKAFQGAGVATRLLLRSKDWAGSVGVQRLELTVVGSNERAISLYMRLGYTVEGVRRQSLMLDGRPVDELYMALLMDREVDADGT